MTLTPLQLLALLLLPPVLGASVLARLGISARDDALAHLGWAQLAGGLVAAAVLFLWAWLALPWEPGLLVPLLVALALALAVLGGSRRRPLRDPTRPAFAHTAAQRIERGLFLALVLFLVALALARAAQASLLPTMTGDEHGIWAVKAKLLFDCGGLTGEYGRRTLGFPGSHPDYPLLNPLLQLWAHVQAGSIVHVENRFPIQAFVPALVLALAAALRRVLRPAAAGALLLCVLSTDPVALYSRDATADLMVALGLVAALDALLRWRATGAAQWLRLAALSLAFLVWSKNEGLLYLCGILAAVAAGLRPPGRPPWRALAWLALPLAAALATWLTNARFSFENDLATTSAPAILAERLGERIGPLSSFFLELLARTPAKNGGLFAAFLALCLLAPRRALGPLLRGPTVLLALALAGWFLVYLATPHELAWHLGTSAVRVTSQALPAVALWLALALAGDPGLGRYLRAPSSRPSSGSSSVPSLAGAPGSS